MLVLASASPRRKELLSQIGYSFRVIPANVVEVRNAGENAEELVRRLATEKAQHIFEQQRFTLAAESPLKVLGADTVVVIGEEVLGKPKDPADAIRMLRRLSGQTHEVITGICVASFSRVLVAAERTAVQFRHLCDDEIARYVESGEPMDKAGAYAIQGQAARWIPAIQGCYFNVVGLPLSRVAGMLEFEPPPAGEASAIQDRVRT